eukprot:1003524-Rhodomonas_salina.1
MSGPDPRFATRTSSSRPCPRPLSSLAEFPYGVNLMHVLVIVHMMSHCSASPLSLASTPESVCKCQVESIESTILLFVLESRVLGQTGNVCAVASPAMLKSGSCFVSLSLSLSQPLPSRLALTQLSSASLPLCPPAFLTLDGCSQSEGRTTQCAVMVQLLSVFH